jgi:hypothetical protein
MHDGNIKDFLCIAISLLHRTIKIFPHVSHMAVNQEPRDFDRCKPGLWTFGPRAFINKALTEMPAPEGWPAHAA